MPFQKGNTIASKEVKKESYIMMRVTPEFKASVVKAAKGAKISQYITKLIENDMKVIHG